MSQTPTPTQSSKKKKTPISTVPFYLPEAETDYWLTPRGIDERLGLFAMFLQLSAYNVFLMETSQFAVPISGGKIYLQMNGASPKCAFCKQYYLRLYAPEDLKPEFPAHPNCTHFYEVVIK